MKHLTSAFYSNSLQLSLRDIGKLLLGRIVTDKRSSLLVGLYRMPDNGCPCENCRKIIGRPLKQKKEIY